MLVSPIYFGMRERKSAWKGREKGEKEGGREGGREGGEGTCRKSACQSAMEAKRSRVTAK
jgi:hypothetical protein